MKEPKTKAFLDPKSRAFVIENYNWASPFSNFLPGIAGKWGVPLWLYYVNRAQVVSSAGVRDKNGQILEFYSFNKATARVPREGYRTFIRTTKNGKLYEPFQKTTSAKVKQRLAMTASDITITETNLELGFEIEVTFVALPNLFLAGVLRDVKIRNISKKKLNLEVLDGHARVLPYGLDQTRIKGIPRHIEGMMGVDDIAGVPVFRLKQTPDDSEKIGKIEGGHFFLFKGTGTSKTAIVDPEVLFGEAFEYEWPWHAEGVEAKKLARTRQHRDNKTPSAFTASTFSLAPGKEARISSVLGYAPTDDDIDRFQKLFRSAGFVDSARRESSDIIEQIGDNCFTASSEPVFDAYCRQDFLDNVIRGGMPSMLECKDGPSPFYVYSRQNGDLERDYHFFVVDPTYLSQGTGHYRSILQNRRTDAWYFPETGDANLKLFLDLIQLDGYNPLEVKGLTYRIDNPTAFEKWLSKSVKNKTDRAFLTDLASRSFTPGEFVMAYERFVPEVSTSDTMREEVLAKVMSHAVQNEVGELHEGFWVDHWHYNIDLIDIYLMIYPERTAELLFRGDYSFFDDPDVILPRHEKAVLLPDGRVRRYGAVVRDPKKVKMISSRKKDPYRVRTKYGKGSIYKTTLLEKLLCIVTNRLATLDPAGNGVEMEAGKPGWNDSMNGLPGLFGSGLSETSELLRTIKLLRKLLNQLAEKDGYSAEICVELAEFMKKLTPAMKKRIGSKAAKSALDYWKTSNDIKEAYREKTKFGIAGDRKSISHKDLDGFLANGERLLENIFTGANRRKVLSREGVPYTYFENIADRSTKTGKAGQGGFPTVNVREFKQRPVKLFLEGAVHWMKERPRDAEKIYNAVRKSPIFDRKLGMYKSCENMEGETYELGRAVGAYPRGWIENESIYLHMEFKYLLEILRSGLCEQFWRDAKTTLMPFLDPAVYKRSTLEGASFIVSSAYADPKYHGQPFQPRLSGITVEFLHIWILAVAGPSPFTVDKIGGLQLTFEPRLPSWLFTKKKETRAYHDPQLGWKDISIPKNAFGFKFLGRTLVVYENPGRKNTWGPAGVAPVSYRVHWRSGEMETFEGSIAGTAAEAIRNGEAFRIDVKLG